MKKYLVYDDDMTYFKIVSGGLTAQEQNNFIELDDKLIKDLIKIGKVLSK